MKKIKELKHITNWEWCTTVAAWRYYEHRMSIGAASFPCELIEHFFQGEYDNDTRETIAQQFVFTDHRGGESDFDRDEQDIRNRWCKLYAFLKAYRTGFSSVTAEDGKGARKTMPSFFCESTGRWYSADEYVANPYVECFICADFIKSVDGKKWRGGKKRETKREGGL